MRSYFFRIPPEHRGFVKERICAIHHQRLRIIVPLLVALGVLFLAMDASLFSGGGSPLLLWIYTGEDLLFFLVQLGFLIWLLTRPPRVANGVVYGFLTFVLAWACVAGYVEFQRTGGFTTIFLTVLAVAALGLFSVRGIVSLLVATAVFYLAPLFLWSEPVTIVLEKYFPLVALPFLAFAVSRTLYAAVVGNLISTRELEQANAELKEVRLNLLRQDKLASLGVLSAGIAHELNNPLAFIKSNLATLETNHAGLSGPEALVGEDRAIFEECKEGFRRIAEVVQALGTFGRDVPEGQTQAYDLNQGIRTTLVMTRHEAAERRITIDTDLADLPTVPARGSEINQVLLNLILNAFQALSSLPPDLVRVVLVRTKRDPDGIVAEVVNNGPPIPEAIREKIFEPFFSTKAPGAGMGLGLSLCWQIIEQRHRGSLELAGTDPVTFRFRLPF